MCSASHGSAVMGSSRNSFCPLAARVGKFSGVGFHTSQDHEALMLLTVHRRSPDES